MTMKMKVKKWFSILMAVWMLAACVSGFAEELKTTRISFGPGEILSGEGTEAAFSLLNAIQIETTSWKTDGAVRGSLALLSEGREVFTLRAESADSGMLSFCCSLTGSAVFRCHQDQLDHFMLTLVDLVAETGLVKENSLDQIRTAALRAADMLRSVITRAGTGEPGLGLNMTAYLDQITARATVAEMISLDPENGECPGAAQKSTWLLDEKDLKQLVDAALNKARKIPVLGSVFLDGRLHIGSQVITESYLREMAASLQGETVLTLYQNADGEILQARLEIPDISALTTDETFKKVRGIEMTVDHSDSPETGTEASVTSLRLTGLEGQLLSVKRETLPGKEIAPLEEREIYQVGEMNSDELRRLLRGMRLTIAGNALNLIMNLPREVFDMLADRLF